MPTQAKYRDEIVKELRDMPERDMPKLLEIIHYLKAGMKESRKNEPGKKEKDPLLDLKDIAVETGIADLAEHHDYYLYGTPK